MAPAQYLSCPGPRSCVSTQGIRVLKEYRDVLVYGGEEKYGGRSSRSPAYSGQTSTAPSWTLHSLKAQRCAALRNAPLFRLFMTHAHRDSAAKPFCQCVPLVNLAAAPSLQSCLHLPASLSRCCPLPTAADTALPLLQHKEISVRLLTDSKSPPARSMVRLRSLCLASQPPFLSLIAPLPRHTRKPLACHFFSTRPTGASGFCLVLLSVCWCD